MCLYDFRMKWCKNYLSTHRSIHITHSICTMFVISHYRSAIEGYIRTCVPQGSRAGKIQQYPCDVITCLCPRHLLCSHRQAHISKMDLCKTATNQNKARLVCILFGVYCNSFPRSKLFLRDGFAPRYWPLCGEFTGHRWIPHTNGQ